jgi:hypothetical protein
VVTKNFPATEFPNVTHLRRAPASDGRNSSAQPDGDTSLQPRGSDAGGLLTPEDVRELVESMPLGVSVFDAPSSMNIQAETIVRLRISEDQKVGDKITKNLSRGISIEPIRISSRMTAQLTAPDGGFDINPTEAIEKLVGGDAYCEWEWGIKAKQGGDRRLHLTVKARVQVPGNPDLPPKEIPVEDKVISVNVTWGYRLEMFGTFFVKDWHWLVTTLILPLLGFLWKLWFKKKSDN